MFPRKQSPPSPPSPPWTDDEKEKHYDYSKNKDTHFNNPYLRFGALQQQNVHHLLIRTSRNPNNINISTAAY
ncbi:hypothetical protein ACFX2J_018984 [Malus domestica]